MLKVLVTPRSFGQKNPELFTTLQQAGVEVIRNETGKVFDVATMCSLLAPCQGVIVGIDPLTAQVLAQAPHLRAIAKYGVGLDNIDLAVCKARGIAVSRTVGANSQAVADFAFALMFAVARHIPALDRTCHKQEWKKFSGLDLYGQTLGIIGLGAIGQAVALRAKGFAMRVLAYDPCRNTDFATQNGVEYVDLEQLCREADLITLHAALTEENKQLINATRLAQMKSTAILINTARGELVDEKALLDALQHKRLYGAGLDVFSQEPPLDPLWYQLENVVLSSHCASSTAGAVAKMGQMAVHNLLRDLGI